MKKFRRTCDDGTTEDVLAEDSKDMMKKTSQYMNETGATSCNTEVIDSDPFGMNEQNNTQYEEPASQEE